MNVTVLAPFFVVALLVVFLIVSTLAFVRQGQRAGSEVLRAGKYLYAWRLGSLVLGLVVGGAWVATQSGGLGRWAALGPILGAMLALAATVAAEMTSPVTRTARRVASLAPRRVREILPRFTAIGVGIQALILVGALVFAIRRGVPDDLGRPGRAVGVTGCPPGGFRDTVQDPLGALALATRGPWPGSYYAVPLLVALAGLGVMLGVSVWAALNRPPPTGELVQADAALRRWSVRSSFNIAGTGVAAVSFPIFVFMAIGLTPDLAEHVCLRSPSPIPALTCAALALASVGAFVVNVAGALMPPSLPATPPGPAVTPSQTKVGRE